MTTAPEIQATVHPLYAVPLLQGIIPDAQALNRDLAELFLRREAEGERWRNKETYDTQHGIFESDFTLHEWPEPCVQHLFTAIRSTLMTFIQGINAYSDEQMANMQLDMHSWFHITRKGGFQGTHIHPNASWSAIYCVDQGDDDPNSGAVRFHDPRQSFDMWRDPANDNLQVPYRISHWQLKHRPGQLIGFPSYLPHEVFPYMGERPRIIIALNAWSRWRT